MHGAGQALNDRATRTRKADADRLAPCWHTAALIFLILAVAAVGTALSRTGAAPLTEAHAPYGIYLPLLLAQWALVVYVGFVGRAGNALPALIGRAWEGPRRAVVDAALAAAGWVLIEASEAAVHRLGTPRSAAVLAMLPHSRTECVAWVLVATSAGFCEEVVYRGYLQTQLTAFAGRATVAVVLQAMLFGVAHSEQGMGVALRFAIYAVGLGALARWRRSLVPGIVCHVALDLASGLMAA